jgi:hypothetical protein
VLLIAVVLLAGASTAWACAPFPLPQALTSIQPRSSGPPKTKVVVNGLGFDHGRPVEIRWNGVEGETLGTATGPNFAVPITIPDVPSGLYGVIALSRGSDGAVGTAGMAPFQVTGEDSAADGPGEPSDNAVSERSAPSEKQPSPVPGLASKVGLLALGAIAGGLFSRRVRRT